MPALKNKKKKSPSFKDVVLDRMFWLKDGAPKPGKPPLWSLGGHIQDHAAMDLALSCIDGKRLFDDMEPTHFPTAKENETLSLPLMYLRMYFLQCSYVARHEKEDPACQWDKDDNDMDSEPNFLIMRAVEAAYRMGYEFGWRAAAAEQFPAPQEDHDGPR